MTKAELAEKIAEEFEMSKAEAARVVDFMFNNIANSIKAGDDVSIAGFGKFERRHRAARQTRNPRTGETMMSAAKNVPAFKAGKALKDLVAA